MFDLDDDALGLIRAARGGDDPSAEEKARAVAAFRAELQTQSAAEARIRSEERESAEPRALRVVGSNARPRLRRWSLTWSIAALVSLASVGAFADWQGVLHRVRDWSHWPGRILGHDAAESASVTSGPRRSAKPGELNPQPEVPSAAPVANEMQWPEPALVGPSVVAAPNVAAGPGEVRGEPAGTVLPKPALPVPSLVGPALPVPANGSAALAAKSSAALPAQPKPGSGAASSATAAGSELQAELALIGFARDALSAGDYVQARAWARQHAQRFASGSLVVERQAIDALASCRAGQGRELGAAFVARWSDSLFTPRVIRDCSLTNSVPSATMPGTDR